MRLWSMVVLFACAEQVETKEQVDEGLLLQDADGDGFFANEDCDDGDASIHPNASELCDGIDNNCDGQFDEGVLETFYADADGDGFGNADLITEACEPPQGFVGNGSDCDDSEAAVYPSAEEVCDELDNNCDGVVDEELTTTYFVDNDNDGFGDADATVMACDLTSGLSAIDGDCNDNDAMISPIAEERCDQVDNNCNGETDEGVTTLYYADADADGYGDGDVSMAACEQLAGYVLNADDCNDADTMIFPAAPELCDGIDNNCDTVIDEATATDVSIWYQDSDMDGYGDAGNTIVACAQPAGFVAEASDCDDGSPSVYPTASERCNGVDDNCDGAIDESTAIDAAIWYADNDADGYGNQGSTQQACSQPLGFVSDSQDCDDYDNDIYPGAQEYCNGEDDNCDGTIDEPSAADANVYYADTDLDGYGDAAVTIQACTVPGGYVADSTDCDDTTMDIAPGNTEFCNGVDDNCDGSIDEASAANANTYYADFDNDGHGDPNATIQACDLPVDYSLTSDDCDDNDDDIHPNAVEICDQIDNDCDGQIDDADVDLEVSTTTAFYADNDGDGYGLSSTEVNRCEAPANHVLVGNDCDDQSEDVYPNAPEYCNGVDDNCNGQIDEGSAINATLYYADMDGDGYGDPDTEIGSCHVVAGHVDQAGDCDDADAQVNPDQSEVCNLKDDNCDGATDDASAIDQSIFYADGDGDGYGDPDNSTTACYLPADYSSSSNDCDDGDALINPSAVEVCDSVDNDCDGFTDDTDSDLDLSTANLYYEDGDGDGYGDPDSTLHACVQPSDYVTNGDDCLDNNASIYPDANGDCIIGQSCREILDNGGSIGDGYYYIDIGGGDVREVYCDMTTDGGGWTMLIGNNVTDSFCDWFSFSVSNMSSSCSTSQVAISSTADTSNGSIVLNTPSTFLQVRFEGSVFSSGGTNSPCWDWPDSGNSSGQYTCHSCGSNKFWSRTHTLSNYGYNASWYTWSDYGNVCGGSGASWDLSQLYIR